VDEKSEIIREVTNTLAKRPPLKNSQIKVNTSNSNTQQTKSSEDANPKPKRGRRPLPRDENNNIIRKPKPV
jgi:hypothetical protein